MQMTEEEICKSFKEAKDHRKQVSILADLNCCRKHEIRKILMKNGIDPPRTGNRYTKLKNSDFPEIRVVPRCAISILKKNVKDIDEELKILDAKIQYLKSTKKELTEFLKGWGEYEQEQSNDADEV